MGTTLIRNDLVVNERVPSLSHLAHVQTLSLIVKSVEEIGENHDFKERIQNLPRNLIDELFNAAFFNSHSNVISTKIIRLDQISINKMKLYPPTLLSKLRSFQDEKIFYLWWMFFDEEYSFKIGIENTFPTFSTMLMKYLKTINSNLEDLVISYSWILRQEFKYLLDHLKCLKKLTVYSNNAEKNVLEDVAKSNCQLQSFKFSHNKNKKLGKAVMKTFFESQKTSICEVDMTYWTQNLSHTDRLEVFESLKNCQKLQKLHLHVIDLAELGEHQDFGEITDLLFVKSTIKDFTISYVRIIVIRKFIEVIRV